jgi:hypothetical protein
MIRPFTCVCMLLAGGAGLYLYQAKHQAQLVDREITRTVKLAEATRERAGVLRAEYALLNDPQRLKELAGEHLAALQNTAPTQFTTWSEFEKRLPPVGAPKAAAAPLEPEAPAARLPEPKPDPQPEPEAAKPVAAAHQPADAPAGAAATVVAMARPAPVAPRPRPVPRPAQAPAPAAAPTHAAPIHAVPAQTAPMQTPPVQAPVMQAQPGTPRPVGAPVSLTASLLASAAPARAVRPPAGLQPGTLQASTTPASYTPPSGSAAEAVARIARGGPVDPSVPAVASALGMARAVMSAPQVTPASAATLWQPGGGQAGLR